MKILALSLQKIPLLQVIKFDITKVSIHPLPKAVAIRETVTFSSPSSTNIYNVKSNRTLPDRINFCFSMGVLYKINYKYALFIEPNYKIDVRAIYETLLDDSHSYGLRTTLIYKFKY